MVTRYIRMWLPVLALLCGTQAARAQIFTPTFMSPYRSNDLGVYVSEGLGTGIEAIWRRSGASGFDLGLRGGFVDAGDGAFTAGIELRNPLNLGTAPLDLAFTAGGQGVFGDFTALGAQAGVSVGGRLPIEGGVTVAPYIHPRVAFSKFTEPETEGQVDVLADLGVDLGFQPNLSLRFDVGLGHDAPDWGIGLAWRR